MSPPWWRISLSGNGVGANLPGSGRGWFWGILGLAVAARLLWLALYQTFIGADAIRYLWISQHVSRGEWLLLPQLYTSPLLPALVGLLARFTGDHLLAGRIVCLLGNTLAVGLAMLLVRRLFPQRPVLAWLTGLGLAVNHVWGRMASFVLTDNLFFPLLLGLLLLQAHLRERVSWGRAGAFGAVWGLLFLSREIGLYCGALVFIFLLGSLVWNRAQPEGGKRPLLVAGGGSLAVLALILLLWGAWYHRSLGVVSLGEGRRFYTSYTQKFDREARHPYYDHGTLSFFQLRPYEVMEFTRFPPPGDDRYPQPVTLTLLAQPRVTLQLIWDNLGWSFKEFQRVTLPGWLTVFVLMPLGLLSRRLSLPVAVWWVFGASLGVLGLHFLGPVREARLIGWFFPWLYLGLAGLTLWLWGRVKAGTWPEGVKKSFQILLVGLLAWHLLYPQYFKEVPRRWPVRLAPQVHTLASQGILQEFGHGAVIASREPEVVFRSGGYWIGLPYGTAEEVVAWLYLGGATHLFFHDAAPIPEAETIFWASPARLQTVFPELEVVAEYDLAVNSAYGKRGRLLRFRPRPETLARYQTQFPWAGTHPRTTGAWASESRTAPFPDSRGTD